MGLVAAMCAAISAASGLEIVRAGDEIGFAIHFDQNAEFAIGANGSADEALFGAARFFVAGAGDAFLAQDDFGFGRYRRLISTRAFLQSIMPAPVRSRSCLTSCALISAIFLFPSIHTRGDQAWMGWSPVKIHGRR